MRIQELGHIVFYVTDLERSARFYREVLGFREIAHRPGMALFSGGRTHHEMLLLEIGGVVQRDSFPKPGLYHVGFKIGDGPEAAREAYAYLKKNGVDIIGTADHSVTHSIYIHDPDGNELELYADVSDAWQKDPLEILRPTRPLDLE